MVTTQEIESLGWSLEGTYRNGGSKGLVTFIIFLIFVY